MTYHYAWNGEDDNRRGRSNKSGYVAKDLKIIFWLLAFPLMCIAFFYLNASHRNLGRIQAPRFTGGVVRDSDGEGEGKEKASNVSEHVKSLITSLVGGADKTKLEKNGLSCVKDPSSTFCVTYAAVRVPARPTRTAIIYLSDGQRISSKADTFAVKPYPRTWDPEAMKWTEPVELIAGEPAPPLCDVTHAVPAVVFSVGGLAGNLFNDVTEVLMPLFLTAGIFRRQVQLVVADYQPYWVQRYRGFLSRLSAHEPVAVSSPLGDVYGSVHCFPAAVVGLKFHEHLVCNASEPPGGVGTMDFKRFLHESFSLKVGRLMPSRHRPLLLFLWRWKSRALLNDMDVVKLAEEIGFRVDVGWPSKMTNMEEFSELVNSCSVLMGVHGSGLTNMVFLPAGAVVLQIVPLGLDSQADAFFGRSSAERLGLKYLEYKISAEESSLVGKYPRDHPILANPSAMDPLWYNMTRPLYTHGQNVTIDLGRFRGILRQAMEFLPNSSSSSSPPPPPP